MITVKIGNLFECSHTSLKGTLFMLNTLVGAWSNRVACDYLSGTLVSERSLQASFYFHLRNLAPNTQFYVEPKVKYDGPSPSRIPDLVVGSDSEVVAVVELKFFPWWNPKKGDIYKDIDRLYQFKTLPFDERINLAIEPSTGDFGVGKTISREAIYVFGVVARDVRAALQRHDPWARADDELRPFLHVLYGDISSRGDTAFEFGHLGPADQ